MIATTLLTPWMVSGYEALSSPELNSKDEVFDSDNILSAGRALSYYLSMACLVLCLLGTAIGRLSLKPSDNKAASILMLLGLPNSRLGVYTTVLHLK